MRHFTPEEVKERGARFAEAHEAHREWIAEQNESHRGPMTMGMVNARMKRLTDRLEAISAEIEGRS